MVLAFIVDEWNGFFSTPQKRQNMELNKNRSCHFGMNKNMKFLSSIDRFFYYLLILLFTYLLLRIAFATQILCNVEILPGLCSTIHNDSIRYIQSTNEKPFADALSLERVLESELATGVVDCDPPVHLLLQYIIEHELPLSPIVHFPVTPVDPFPINRAK